MKRAALFSTVSALLVSLFCVTAAHSQDSSEAKSPQVVILKLDDVVGGGWQADKPVSDRWLRVTDFIEKEDIKASFGIIGYSLEEDNPYYFNWVKKLQKEGRIEFWNHGYKNRKGEDPLGEFEGTYEEQKESLVKTQKLAKEKLGINLTVFGPHWSGTNEATEKALSEIPEIKMVYHYTDHAGKYVFPRIMAIENPTHVPDFEKFKATYESSAKDKPCLALQGHPNSWDDDRWANFVQIVVFLKAQGCVFMKPSEYYEKFVEKTE